jgi:7,8-dihydropterin-6-yl-methyl-4-(beta-D-ribofuranosyl)aminobenzene 5'-phosphate synthase
MTITILTDNFPGNHTAAEHGLSYMIMGGFHLKEIDRQTRETIQYLRENNIQHVYPSHCTALPVLLLFLRTFNSEQVVTGKVFEF